MAIFCLGYFDGNTIWVELLLYLGWVTPWEVLVLHPFFGSVSCFLAGGTRFGHLFFAFAIRAARYRSRVGPVPVNGTWRGTGPSPVEMVRASQPAG